MASGRSDVKHAKTALQQVFENMAIPREETVRRLKELRDEIDEMLEALKDG